jgi:hypothetical protein
VLVQAQDAAVLQAHRLQQAAGGVGAGDVRGSDPQGTGPGSGRTTRVPSAAASGSALT